MGSINTLLSLDGESEFRRQLNLINANLKTLESELKATASEFVTESGQLQHNTKLITNYSKQIEFLKAKEDVLQQAVAHTGQALEQARTKIESSRAAYEKSQRMVNYQKIAIESLTAAYGVNSKEVQDAQLHLAELQKAEKLAAGEVTKAEKNVDKIALSYQRYKSQLGDTRNQLNQVQSAEGKVGAETKNTASSIDIASKATQAWDNGLKILKASFDATVKSVSALGRALATAASAEVKAFELSIKAVSEEVKLAADGFNKYVEGVAKITKAIAGFAYESGATFEESMSKVQAYSGVSTTELEQLAQAAKDAGATTSKKASEAADALGYLALNGYKTEEMLNTLMPVVKASEAGALDLATTANLTARSLTAYGKGSESAEEMLNILVAAQNNSSTSLNDLLTAYADMAGSFKTLDISMEESATILGVFANQGKSGAEAATALNAVMLRLLGTNNKAFDALESIGVSAWNEDGSFRGLTTTLRDLGSVMGNLTKEQEILLETQIGGVMRVQELKKLIDGVMDEESYNKVADPIRRAFDDKVLYSTAEIMLSNLKGSITLLKSAMESLGIAIFETFGKRLTDTTKKVTEWVTMLKNSVEKGNIEGAITRVMQKANKEVKLQIGYIASKMPRYLNLINQVIVDGAKYTLEQADKIIVRWLPILLRSFTNLLEKLAAMLPDAARVLAKGATTYFRGLITALQKVSKKIIEVLPEVTRTISEFFRDNASDLYLAGLDILISLAQGISENLPQLVDTAVQIIKEICHGINQRIDIIIETGGAIIGELARGIIEVLPNLIETGFRILTSLVRYITQNIDEILNAAEPIIEELGKGIIDNLPLLLQSAIDIVLKLVEYITQEDNLEKLIDAAVEIITALGKALFDNIDRIIEDVFKAVDNIVKYFLDDENLNKLYDAGTYLGAAIVEGIVDAFKNLIPTGVDIGIRSILRSKGISGPVQDALVGVINSRDWESKSFDFVTSAFDGFKSNSDTLDYISSLQSPYFDAAKEKNVSETKNVDVAFYGDINVRQDTGKTIYEVLEESRALITEAELGKGR